MNVFVTGSTGVLGHRIVSELSESGHDVVGLVRDESGEKRIDDLGGEPVRGDVLDESSLRTALDGRDVDAVVHAATKLPTVRKTTAEYWERNDEVRVTGARNLLNVLGEEIDQFLFPSVVWVARQPDGSAFEEDADRHPDRATQSAATVEDRLREASESDGFDAAIIRLGFLYSADGGQTRQFAESLVDGDLPIIGGGLLGLADAELSLLHADDAGRAFRAAVDAGLDGCYHVVDDEPVTAAAFLRTFATLLDAPEPRRVPWWLARPLAGKDAVRFMTSAFPTTNDAFRSATDWEPHYQSVEDGLETVVENWREDGTLSAMRGESSVESS